MAETDLRSRFRWYQAPILSLFSHDFYHDVMDNWKLLPLLAWFAALICISWWSSIVPNFFTLQQGLEEELPPFTDQMPLIQIRDGVAHTPEPGPHYIYFPESGDVFAVIDTSGQMQELPDGVERGLLVTDQQAILFDPPDAPQTAEFGVLGDVDIDGPFLLAFLDKWGTRILMGGMVGGPMFSLLFRGAIVLVCALIAMMMCNGRSYDLFFGAAMRLSVAAHIPMILAQVVVETVGITQYFCCMWEIGWITMPLVYIATMLSNYEPGQVPEMSLYDGPADSY